MSLRRALIAMWCLVAVGCAQRTNEPTGDAVGTAGPAAAATTPVADDAATSDPASVAAPAEVNGSSERSIPAPEPAPPPSVSTAAIVPDASELAAVAPAVPAPREFKAPPGPSSSSVMSPTSAETLDLSSLLTRLRKTNAINLRTKVAVKHESDDLLEQFRAYHTQRGVVTLADLRRSYDLLFHRLYSLLEDADPPLARDIDRSRGAIWDLLADPRRFSASVMTGA